jgi:hypothetical protein
MQEISCEKFKKKKNLDNYHLLNKNLTQIDPNKLPDLCEVKIFNNDNILDSIAEIFANYDKKFEFRKNQYSKFIDMNKSLSFNWVSPIVDYLINIYKSDKKSFNKKYNNFLTNLYDKFYEYNKEFLDRFFWDDKKIFSFDELILFPEEKIKHKREKNIVESDSKIMKLESEVAQPTEVTNEMQTVLNILNNNSQNFTFGSIKINSFLNIRKKYIYLLLFQEFFFGSKPAMFNIADKFLYKLKTDRNQSLLNIDRNSNKLIKFFKDFKRYINKDIDNIINYEKFIK